MQGGPPPAPYSFAPTDVSVACGGTVRVSNTTMGTHNVTPKHGGFQATDNIGPHGSATVRMLYRGTYGFYCTLHPTDMNGTVHVT